MTSLTHSPERHAELVSASIVPRVRSKGGQPKRHRKVRPFGIGGVYQVDLPLPSPVLELLFARDGMFHVVEQVEMDKAMDVMARGEARQRIGPVLPQAGDEIRCHADIQRTVGPARKDIGAWLALLPHGAERVAKWILKQVQDDETGRNWSHTRHAELVSASIVPQAVRA